MRSNRSVNVLVATAFALTAFGAFLPSASAQTPVADTTLQLEITPYDAAIKPLSDLAVIPVTVKYSYTSNGVALIATQVTLKVVEQPSWASVTISPATLAIPVASGGAPSGTSVQATPVSAKILVTTTADAPAFTNAPIKISASAAQNGNLKPQTAEESTPIRADYFSIIDAVASTTIQIATPQSQVAYPITVTNFGNAQTKLFFEVADKPESWQVVAPTPITLDSKQAGGKNTAQTVNLMIQTPFRNGYLNEVGAVTMKITSSYALDNKVKGDQTQVSTLTTTKGFYVPGFSPLYLLAALGAIALVVRRRA